MRRYRFLLLVILLGLVPIAALVAGVWLYLDEAESPPESVVAPEPPPPPPVEVLASARSMLGGTLLTENDITSVSLRPAAVLSSHLRRDTTEPSALAGSVVRIALLADMPLTWAVLVRPGQDGFLAAVLTPEHRAITITVDQETSHAGLIAPGDRVDVIFTLQVTVDGASRPGSFSRTVLEDIRVVAVGRHVESTASGAESAEGEEDRRADSTTVTLEVLPKEADQLMLAAVRGNISLVLRPLSQTSQVGWRAPVGLDSLLPPGPAPVRVRIFRGNSREEMIFQE